MRLGAGHRRRPSWPSRSSRSSRSSRPRANRRTANFCRLEVTERRVLFGCARRPCAVRRGGPQKRQRKLCRAHNSLTELRAANWSRTATRSPAVGQSSRKRTLANANKDTRSSQSARDEPAALFGPNRDVVLLSLKRIFLSKEICPADSWRPSADSQSVPFKFNLPNQLALAWAFISDERQRFESVN